MPGPMTTTCLVGSRHLQLLRVRGLLTPGSKVDNRALLHGLPPTEEFDDVAQYPDLPKFATEKEKNEHELVQKVASLKTVEERQFYVNKPKYYGWYTCKINVEKIPYGTLALAQRMTMTSVERGLPEERYGANSEKDSKAAEIAEKLALSVRSMVVEANRRESHRSDVRADKVFGIEATNSLPAEVSKFKHMRDKTSHFVKTLNRFLVKHLISDEDCRHLLAAQVDFNSRNEGFWFKSGFYPDRKMVLKRQSLKKHSDEYLNDPVKSLKYHRMLEKKYSEEDIWEKYDKAIQVIGNNIMQLRYAKMVSPYVGVEDPVSRKGKHIPEYPYDPKSHFPYTFRHGTNSPGFWPSSNSGFVQLQFVDSLNREDKLSTETSWKEPEAREEMLLTKGILASFSQCMAQSTHLGFGPFIDPEHPIVIQTVVTDGERFKFFAYQMNRTALYKESEEEEVLTNIVWHSEEKPLYQKNSAGDVSVDQDVLKSLIMFYMEQPLMTMRPDASLLENVGQNYNRESFYNTHRYMFSNRPRSVEKPSIESWQRIRMINHPELDFHRGLRERPWFKMARYDWRGREHWHPEFKHLDHYEPAYQPVKFRPEKHMRRVKKVVAPIPAEEEMNQEAPVKPDHDK